MFMFEDDQPLSPADIRISLLAAEEKAMTLFNAIESKGLMAAGRTEKQLNTDIYLLAFEMFGIKKYWHKRIVRAGRNTLQPYRENPPDLTLQTDDILFLDFGPVFDEWEADFGRTYVIGNDPLKQKLKEDVASAWADGRDWYRQHSSLTGAELYAYCATLAGKYGWSWGGPIAGHLVGKFPHENIESEHKDNYIHPDNHRDMFLPDKNGNHREWILEIHFVNREKEIGGFYEQLLF